MSIQVHGLHRRVASGALIAVVAAASTAPSIAINVDHVTAGGGSWPLALVAVMSVIAAPVCLLAAPKLFCERRIDLAAAAALLFTIALAFNLSNAIGLAGSERDHRREAREAQATRVQLVESRLATVRTSLADYRKAANGSTPAMADAELAGLRGHPIYTRSSACANVTVEDSKDHCGKIASTLARKAAAEQVAALTAEERDLTAKLVQFGAAPSSTDAKVERIVSILGVPSAAGARWVGISLDMLTAVLVELLGAFLAPIVAVMMQQPRRAPVTADAVIDLPSVPEPAVMTEETEMILLPAPKAVEVEEPQPPAPVPDVPASVSAFVKECVHRKKGASVKAADLYAAYEQHARASGVLAETNTGFGIAIAKLGFAKEAKRVRSYPGVALRAQKPKLRVVSSN